MQIKLSSIIHIVYTGLLLKDKYHHIYKIIVVCPSVCLSICYERSAETRSRSNNAEYGAALKLLDQSVVFLAQIYSHIQFINNSTLIGGALFVQEANIDINNIPLCIFQSTLPQGTPQ